MKYLSAWADEEEEEEESMQILILSSTRERGLIRRRMEGIKTLDDDDNDDIDNAPLLNLKLASLFVLGFMSLVSMTAYVTSIRSPPTPTILHYSCPATFVEHTDDIDGPEYIENYLNGTMSILTNVTEFLETFRTSEFDNWGKTYEQFKEGLYDWKAKHFAPNIENGDSIYESACGVGLNLYMTLEILNEVKGIESLVVHGNEYLKASAEKANAVFDNIAPFRSVKGQICQADSTDLYFVPSNVFDLVYTGYLNPLYDPLHINKTFDEDYEIYGELCEAEDKLESTKLSEMAQKVQNDFHGKWVAEMARIAKPGKAIIIENVGQPYCNDLLDWGGVAKEFWQPAIEEYRWDVDPDSLVMEDKDEDDKSRYHVFMRKNPAPS